VLASAVVLAPYASALLREPAQPSPLTAMTLTGRVGLAVQALATPFTQVAGLGLGYFFDADWAQFARESGPGAALGVVAPLVAAAVAGGTLLGLLLGLRIASPGLRRVARLGLWTWVLHAGFLGLLALPPEPHYQQPVLWIPVAGWALAVAALWPGRPRAAGTLAGLALAVGLWGLLLQRSWMGWIRSQGGTRGIHYGLTLGAQRAALAEACAAETPGIALELQVTVFPQSLRSLARTEPACSNRRVEICGPLCPRPPAGWTVATLRYLDTSGAQLAPVHPAER